MRGAAGAVAVALLLGAAAGASAQGPIIGPGREEEVTALLAPHALGEEVADGWTLHAIRIGAHRITVSLRAADGAEARLELAHPEHAPDASARAPSFAVLQPDDPASAAARAALLRALRANDDGTFWDEPPVLAPGGPREPSGERAGPAVPRPTTRESPAGPVLVALLAVVGAGLGLLRRGRSRE